MPHFYDRSRFMSPSSALMTLSTWASLSDVLHMETERKALFSWNLELTLSLDAGSNEISPS